MDSSGRFGKKLAPKISIFYGSLNVTGMSSGQAKGTFKIFNNKNLYQHHDVYVQSDTLLLSDVFENFRDKYIEIYELDLPHVLSVPGLAWEACFEKTEKRLEL